jgi:hypothetical protein
VYGDTKNNYKETSVIAYINPGNFTTFLFSFWLKKINEYNLLSKICILEVKTESKNEELENYEFEISFEEVYCDMTPNCQNLGVRQMSETFVTGR